MNKTESPIKVALAHDSFTQLGGAERVVDAFHEMYPNAPVFTLVLDRKLKKKYKGWDIRTSWLQVFYNFIPKLQYLFPLIPLAVSSLDFSGYDVVLSSSSGFIKNIKASKGVKHINYCHTPARFLWSEPEYVNQEVLVLIKPLIKLLLGWMKKWDYSGAQRVTKFLANSKEVQGRIKKYYNRESEVVYPFVNLEFWHSTVAKCHCEECTRRSNPYIEKIASDALAMTEKKHYFLLAGRLQAHKNNELIVEIFNELGLPLHVVGTGRQEDYLRSISKPNISFLGKVGDKELRDQYSGALGYIYPQAEDFGLMPLEAAACGTATLAYGKAGALETIIAGQTGEFFEAYDKEKIKQIILNWNPEKYKADVLRAQAEKFSKEKFETEILNIVNQI